MGNGLLRGRIRCRPEEDVDLEMERTQHKKVNWRTLIGWRLMEQLGKHTLWNKNPKPL